MQYYMKMEYVCTHIQVINCDTEEEMLNYDISHLIKKAKEPKCDKYTITYESNSLGYSIKLTKYILREASNE